MLQNISTTLAPAATESPLLEIIRAEYREMPGLRLTKPQMRRLWGLDQNTCDTVVSALERQHVLKRAADRYVLDV